MVTRILVICGAYRTHERVTLWCNRESKVSLLAEALFLVFVDGRKETSAMGRE